MTDPFYDPIAGDARELVDVDEAGRWRARGVLREDTRRRRPLWFDGRFLAARDLTREQQYILARQSDLGRMMGFGVAAGLVVQADGNRITVTAGHGITPSGELIALLTPATFALDDLPATERINATLGLGSQPARIDRNRTGLFVLAARPIEYTARPTARYPTTLTGDRGVEDGEIVEAVAFSLVPFDDDPADKGGDRRRARAAHDIFVRGVSRRLSPEVLPLAMLALDRGVLMWVDHYLVRRDAGVENVLGFGLGHRAVREAHLRQYDAHLQTVMSEAGEQIAAVDHFASLPPVGPLPRGAVRLGEYGLDQRFFPAQMDVRLSLVPIDELPSLLEDSLALPPIDLSLPDPALEATPVLVLIPVDRAAMAPLAHELAAPADAAGATPVHRLRVDAPLRLIRRQPYAELKQLRRLRLTALEDEAPAVDPDRARLERWADLAAAAPSLWYVRRRTPADVAGVVGFARPGAQPPIGDLPPDWPVGDGPDEEPGDNGEVVIPPQPPQPIGLWEHFAAIGEADVFSVLMNKYDYMVRDSLSFRDAPYPIVASPLIAVGQLYTWALAALREERLPDEALRPPEPERDGEDLVRAFVDRLRRIADAAIGFEGGNGDLGRTEWVDHDVLRLLEAWRPSRHAARVLGAAGVGLNLIDELTFTAPEDRSRLLERVIGAAEERDIYALFELLPARGMLARVGYREWASARFGEDERARLAAAVAGEDAGTLRALDTSLAALGGRARVFDGPLADVLLGAFAATVAGPLDQPLASAERIIESRRHLDPAIAGRVATALTAPSVRVGLAAVLDALGEKPEPRLVLGASGAAAGLGALVARAEGAARTRLVKQIVKLADTGGVEKLRALAGGAR